MAGRKCALPYNVIIDTIMHFKERVVSTDVKGVKGEGNQRSNEAATIVKTKLCDIPPVILHMSTTYELRGVICYHKGKSNLRNSIGHYNTFCRRGTRNWELYDDLKKKNDTCEKYKDDTM